MEAREFVDGIRQSVIEENLSAYKDLFVNTKQASDPYWKEALTFFNMLNEEQRVTFFKIICQVEVDTVSNVLGILDGDTFLSKQRDRFNLTVDGSLKPINGDLQAIFLETENG